MNNLFKVDNINLYITNSNNKGFSACSISSSLIVQFIFREDSIFSKEDI